MKRGRGTSNNNQNNNNNNVSDYHLHASTTTSTNNRGGGNDYMKRYLEHEQQQHNNNKQHQQKGSSLIGTLIGGGDKQDSSSSSSSTKDNKYLPVWKQEVTDERGRKRFHGAFTGGYSAGYFNTVGSKEGWTPTAFKSSKDDRSSFKQYSTSDFMDEEDQRELASKELKTKSEFDLFGGTASFMDTSSDSNNNNNNQNDNTSKLLFEGVFKDIVKPNSDPIGLKLLKRMGWKEGQTRVVKKHYQKRKPKKQIVIVDNDFGVGFQSTIVDKQVDEQEDEEEEEEVTVLSSIEFGKEYAKSVEYAPKNDLYGVGYEPSAEVKQMRQNIQSITSSSPMTLKPSTNKPKQQIGNRLTFAGLGYDDDDDQDEDNDIYNNTNNLLRYDKTLGKNGGLTKTGNNNNNNNGNNNNNRVNNSNVDFLMPKDTSARHRKCSDGSLPLRGYVVSLQTTLSTKWFKPPSLPSSYVEHRHRYTAPLDPAIINKSLQLVSTNTFTADKRSIILDEVMLTRDQPKKQQQQQQQQGGMVPPLIRNSAPLATPNQQLESIQKAFASRFVSAEEGLNIAKSKELPDSKKVKPIRTTLTWRPESLLSKRFGLVPDNNNQHSNNNRSGSSRRDDNNNNNQLDWDLNFDHNNQSTTTKSSSPAAAVVPREESFIQAERPPMDLFKAIFESNDEELSTNEDFDPFNFTEPSTTTTTTTTTNNASTSISTTYTPIHKIEQDNLSKSTQLQDDTDGDQEEYDPFKEFKNDNHSNKVKQQPIVNIQLQPIKTTNNNNNNNNNQQVDDEDEEEYDPFSAFVKQNQSNKPITLKVNNGPAMTPTTSTTTTTTNQPQSIKSIDKDILMQPTVPPPPSPQPPSFNPLPLPPPPKDQDLVEQPTYYKVINIKPAPPPLKVQQLQQQRMVIDVDSDVVPFKQVKKREKEDQWVESIKSYLSNFSDSSSSSSDSDSDNDKRRKERKREKKEKKREKKERKKEKRKKEKKEKEREKDKKKK
ncbi:putative G-patch-containing protein [Cavenderia fasciculata]|uniref:G-patch-containing protein n=1 Tax=Cavenderia fasciculata TaxID=261658 RepID=F4Q0I7_CACFS|nr:putative G-patch-containing protein [Cavenderia fasciculata]EGG18338.1 putative G-patch-containing protein [Cavenderia fasciculata]|eukprot:XP_004366242.1 putative G-patch-containing protein [Cavenderia fasciculata]